MQFAMAKLDASMNTNRPCCNVDSPFGGGERSAFDHNAIALRNIVDAVLEVVEVPHGRCVAMLVVVDVREQKNGIVPCVGSRNVVEAVAGRGMHDQVVELAHLLASVAVWSQLLDSNEIEHGYHAVLESCTHCPQNTAPSGESSGARTSGPETAHGVVLGLTWIRRHMRKGGYDVHDGSDKQAASTAATVHGQVKAGAVRRHRGRRACGTSQRSARYGRCGERPKAATRGCSWR